ncbi:Membrane protein OS=Rhodopirellula maiorica SM1 GN=RMSM_00424 PE=4 SV=1 [Gemmata massiliana]|uniref:Membrane protein n=1 Tax=Gemmata massiliana TaxID=1210884 RepID=A0A6P2CVT8_9BACT|nr:hypothetical protein [Gemmata massiliana]VTR92275.1 Membrane protein OS=Rhodopirellula maiorica SM1 GN=RMSM_00424 PE=4 SV=1 [Gemmata massiliana]
MPITFDCTCGKKLRVADEHAGRRVKCPACATVGTVPELEPQFEIVEAPEPVPVPKARPAAARIDDDEDEDARRGYSVAQRGRDEDDDEKEERPRKKKKFKRGSSNRPPQHDHFGFERRVISGGVVGGLLAMLIATVWFVVGLMNDLLFYYPPILFIVGLVAFIKGLMGEE